LFVLPQKMPILSNFPEKSQLVAFEAPHAPQSSGSLWRNLAAFFGTVEKVGMEPMDLCLP
jgi:hypothetical protein